MRDFENMVRAAIQGELEDASFYQLIAAEAPNAELRSIIMSIAGDEQGHARTFSAIIGAGLSDASGYHSPPGTGGNFRRDVRTALEGELGAVSEYAQMALEAPNDELRAIILGIVGDEYGHARTFLTILTMAHGSRSSGGLG